MSMNGCENTEFDGAILKNEIQILVPIIKSGKERIIGNFYFFRNKGNTIVTVDKGLTIAPGETFSMGNTGTYDYMDQDLDFQFGTVNVVIDPVAGEPVGSPVNRLEVVRHVYFNQKT